MKTNWAPAAIDWKRPLKVLLLLTCSLTALSAELCDWQSKTPPDLLQGHQGNGESDNYWFTHVSDVDQVDHKRHFVFGIRNQHPRKILPVEWLRGDGHPQLEFRRLAPGKCGENDFDSSNLFTEDPKAVIHYGPTKQVTKPDAPLYTKVQPEDESKGAVGIPLKSRLVADLASASGETQRVDLEFSTQFEGTEFSYDVLNRGSQMVHFEIPELSKAWNEIASRPGTRITSKWSSAGSRFLAQVNEPAKQVIKLENQVGYSETQAPLQILSPTGELLEAGELTIYLPK